MEENSTNEKLENIESHLSKMTKENGFTMYNLMTRIKIPKDINPLYYSTYTPVKNESFQTISYKMYGTISLWWLICIVNNLYNITEGAVPEIPLKIIKQQYLGNILEEL